MDQLIAFAESDEGRQVFGAEAAPGVAAHGREIKAAGASIVTARPARRQRQFWRKGPPAEVREVQQGTGRQSGMIGVPFFRGAGGRKCPCGSAPGRRMQMKKVKITVLKTTPGRGTGQGVRCGRPGAMSHAAGRAGLYGDYAKPEGPVRRGLEGHLSVCFALAHGAGEGLFYYGDWIGRPGGPSAAATTGCAPSSSSWRPRKRRR